VHGPAKVQPNHRVCGGRWAFKEGELSVGFDGRSVTYGFGELDTLVPAYAASIHKSQGSEYPAVVIPVMTQHYAMLQRNLLYTGVTRGKRLVVLVGQKKAVAIAVRNISGRRRWSKPALLINLSAKKRGMRRSSGGTCGMLASPGCSRPAERSPTPPMWIAGCELSSAGRLFHRSNNKNGLS